MKTFKIGDKVKVIKDAYNAGDFNTYDIPSMGIYYYYNWEQLVFTISSDFKPHVNEILGIKGVYELSLDGKVVGNVYDVALKLQPIVYTEQEVLRLLENYDREFKLDTHAYRKPCNYLVSEWFEKNKK